MRVLLVTNDYPPKPGGIQQYLGNLVAELPAEVRVLAPLDENAELDPAVRRADSTYLWPTRRVASWVGDEVQAFGPDFVLFGAPHPLPQLGPRLRRELGVPFAVLSHGAEVTLPAAVPGIRQILARSLRSADVRFAVSRYTQRVVSRLAGAPVEYVGGGVDTAAFHPPEQRRQHDPPIVGCVSRFVPRKGQERLIEAAAQLGMDVELLFVGRGRTEVRLRTMAADLGVRARFEVDVSWERLPGLYREMDVFCMPCSDRWGGLEVEGLGLVFLEAAASGLPVLAGDSGGAPETVLPGETGFVVHDVDDIVEGLRLLLSDPERARAMGAAGRDRIVNDYTWPKVATRFMSALEETPTTRRDT